MSGQTRIAAATVPGATHLRRGRPNQDAVGWLPASGEGERLVMAVSDGHGGTASPRSHLGSRLAVDVATRLLWELPTPLTEQNLRDAMLEITSTWRREVEDHLDRHPLSRTEIEQGVGEPAPDVLTRLRESPPLAYGATAVFAVIDEQQVGLGQLGDGDILLVSGPEGTHRPLPSDTRLMAHTTTSLCDDDPLDRARLAVLPLACRMVILSTDGYANSFVDDTSFLKVGTDLLKAVDERGITYVRQSLPAWLAETSQKGAGDDISVAAAVTALPGAPKEPSTLQLALRPAIRPVKVRPVCPVELPTAQVQRVPDEVVTLVDSSPRQIAPLAAARSATNGSPPSGIPVPGQSPKKGRGSPRSRPLQGQHSVVRRGAIVAAAGLAAVLGAGAGGYVLLGYHGQAQPSPTHSPNPTDSPNPTHAPGPAQSGPARKSVPATVKWEVSGGGLVVQRHTGAERNELSLPSPVNKLLPVPNGALVLLMDGHVGLLPAEGALRVGNWQEVPASDLVQDGSSYYLLDDSRRRQWTINPRTGAVTSLASGKGFEPFSPPTGTPPVPPEGEPSGGSPGNVEV